MKPEERPSLSQLAAASNRNPWECVRCGCRDWRVDNSYMCDTDKTRHRRRVCRHCGNVMMTYESPTPPLQPNDDDIDELETSGHPSGLLKVI